VRLLLRVIINAVALWITARLVGGVSVTEDFWGLLLVALVFGLVNAFIRPIVKVLTFPLTILTLGLFTFVVNALMLMLVAWLNVGLSIEGGFFTALIGSIVISIVSMILSSVLGDK
jgi:putative membrane protein